MVTYIKYQRTLISQVLTITEVTILLLLPLPFLKLNTIYLLSALVVSGCTLGHKLKNNK